MSEQLKIEVAFHFRILDGDWPASDSQDVMGNIIWNELFTTKPIEGPDRFSLYSFHFIVSSVLF